HRAAGELGRLPRRAVARRALADHEPWPAPARQIPPHGPALPGRLRAGPRSRRALPAAPEAVGAARQPRDLRLAGAAAVLSGRGTAFFGPGLAGAVAVGGRRAALGRAVLLPLPRHG